MKMDCPRAAAEPPRLRSAKARLTIADRPASSRLRRRPARGATPNTRKKSGWTRWVEANSAWSFELHAHRAAVVVREGVEGAEGAYVHLVAARQVRHGPPRVRPATQDDDQAVGVGVPERPQHDPADDAEDGGVRPHPHGQRQHDRRREAGRASQHPERVLQVPPRVVQPRERPRVALHLLRLLDSAEGAPRGEARRLGRHPSAHEVVLQEGQVRRHFPRQLRLAKPGLQEVEGPGEEPPQHDPSPFAQDSFSSSLSTSPASLRQRSVSLRSARPPFRVIA